MSSYQIDDPFSTEDLLRPYLFDDDHFYEDLTWIQEPLQSLVPVNSSNSTISAPEESKYPDDNHKDGFSGVFHGEHSEFYADTDYEWCEGMIEGADVMMSDATFAQIHATSARAVASFPVPQKIFIEDQHALKSSQTHFNSCANVESCTVQNYNQNFHQVVPEVQPHYYESMIDTADRKLKRKLDIEPEYLMNEFMTVPPSSALEEPQTIAPISTSEVDEQISNYSNSFEDDPTGGFKLPASKSPIMEAMVVCALNGWGIRLVQHIIDDAGNPEIIFQVLDFDRYYRISRLICSKQRPTDDVGSRVKSLRRWFTNFPKKKVRCEKGEFLLTVKPNIAKKVSEIIERNTRVLGLMKRRRRQ